MSKLDSIFRRLGSDAAVIGRDPLLADIDSDGRLLHRPRSSCRWSPEPLGTARL